jgi:soluble lytic murein transglycosylase-like protein
VSRRRIVPVALRRTLRRLRARLSRPALLLGALCLALLASLNLAVRNAGGDVHALSLGRVRERAVAVGLLALHAVRCSEANAIPEPALRAAARRHGVSARLVLAVARTESSLVHTRISSTGAMGLMQLMPDTAFELGVTDPYDVAQSSDAGVRYLAQLLALYGGDTRRAVAAYNAGLGRVPVRGQLRLPAETRVYVGRVLAGL